MESQQLARTTVTLPDAPALVAGAAGAVWLDRDGEIHGLSRREAARRAQGGPAPLLCHLPATARRLGIDPFPALDLLELFAFVHPGRFCVPTPRGLADAPRFVLAEAGTGVGKTLGYIAADGLSGSPI